MDNWLQPFSDGRGDMPIAFGRRVELVQQHRNVTPGQLRNRLLRNWGIDPTLANAPSCIGGYG
jgi:hypothetical protein